jgi:hypothetical protein
LAALTYPQHGRRSNVSTARSRTSPAAGEYGSAASPCIWPVGIALASKRVLHQPVSRPTRELIVDILVPSGLLGDDAPLLRWNIDPFPKLDPIAGPPRDGRDTLPTAVTGRRGAAPDPISNPISTPRPDLMPDPHPDQHSDRQSDQPAERDRTPDILERGLELLGWDRSQFVHHRLAMDVPPLLVGLQIRFPLAER